MDDVAPLRIGTLGAARITPTALLRPARTVPGAEVVAVAARDRGRAEKFARKHGIPTVHDSYEALLADPGVDAVYNPLPNGLHGVWTKAALAAGKHVLCEKPFTANHAEAQDVAQAADASSLVVMEAFHYRYHPLMTRLLEIIDSGEIGDVRSVHTRACIPLPFPNDIRFQLPLAGGAVMDIGCYAIHQLRTLASAEPAVVRAETKLRSPGVDRWMRADMEFADGRTGSFECALWSGRVISMGGRVVGTHGELSVFNMTGPQYFHRVTVKSRDPRSGVRSRRRERVKGEATYWYQLQAFVAAVGSGAPILTPPSDAVKNMRVVDDVYRAAGLEPRRPTAA